MIDVTRMCELEKMAEEDNIIYPVTLEEFRYVEKASKMPYDVVAKDLGYLGEIILPLEDIRYIYYLLSKYKCTYKELNQRLKEVHSIKRYKDMISNNLLKEQKRMIKKLNNY